MFPVGNKSDLQAEREVTFLEASRFAQENGTLHGINPTIFRDVIFSHVSPIDLLFLETSAKNGDNVEDVFFKCSKTILSRIDAGRINPDSMGSGIQPGSGKKAPSGTVTGASSSAEPAEGGCSC